MASVLESSIPFLIGLFAYYQLETVDHTRRYVDSGVENLYDNYDFIVIGAGSAGNVVANRLSEVGHWRVLLLEAGDEETDISDIPLLAAYLQLGEFDWQYKTEPQTSTCLGKKT